MDSTHFDIWQAETHEPEGERAWFAWADKAERIAGHDLDGDQSTDGYSLDSAYDAWKQGQTPLQYVASIVTPAPEVDPFDPSGPMTTPTHRTPAAGTPVTTPDGPGIMAGVTGHLYAVHYPDGIPAIGLAPGSVMGYPPADVTPAPQPDPRRPITGPWLPILILDDDDA